MFLLRWPVAPCKGGKLIPARSRTCSSLPLEEDHLSFCFPIGSHLTVFPVICMFMDPSSLELASYLEMHVLLFVLCAKRREMLSCKAE